MQLTENLIQNVAIGSVGIVYAIKKILPRINGKKAAAWNKETHDEICNLKLKSIDDNILTVKDDIREIKEILQKTGEPRAQ
jgi:hypothetical protein